jgi:hypothetical protein
MTDGATERIRCKAAYAVNATGKAVQQTLRCASDSYRFEINSNVISEGGSLSGSWAEATRGASGNISGRASGAEIVVNVAGPGFTAHLDLRTQGDRQSVTIRPRLRRDCRVNRFAQRIRLSRSLSGRPLAARSRHEAAWRESRRRNVAVGRKMKSSAVKTAIVRMRSYWK